MGENIYACCKQGGRASLSDKSLGELGSTNVTVVDTKLSDWAEGGHPIEAK